MSTSFQFPKSHARINDNDINNTQRVVSLFTGAAFSTKIFVFNTMKNKTEYNTVSNMKQQGALHADARFNLFLINIARCDVEKLCQPGHVVITGFLDHANIGREARCVKYSCVVWKTRKKIDFLIMATLICILGKLPTVTAIQPSCICLRTPW